MKLNNNEYVIKIFKARFLISYILILILAIYILPWGNDIRRGDLEKQFLPEISNAHVSHASRKEVDQIIERFIRPRDSRICYDRKTSSECSKVFDCKTYLENLNLCKEYSCTLVPANLVVDNDLDWSCEEVIFSGFYGTIMGIMIFYKKDVFAGYTY